MNDGETEEWEDGMAFGCVLYLKEECDGCGLCRRRGRRAFSCWEDALEDEEAEVSE